MVFHAVHPQWDNCPYELWIVKLNCDLLSQSCVPAWMLCCFLHTVVLRESMLAWLLSKPIWTPKENPTEVWVSVHVINRYLIYTRTYLNWSSHKNNGIAMTSWEEIKPLQKIVVLGIIRMPVCTSVHWERDKDRRVTQQSDWNWI